MFNEFHDCNLPFNLLQYRFGELATVNDFDCNLLASYAMDAQLDETRLALAEGLVEPIGAHVGQSLAHHESIAHDWAVLKVLWNLER